MILIQFRGSMRLKRLPKKAALEAVKALALALKQDPFWAVRAEVAGELGSVKLDQAFEELLLGLQDPEARVRRAVGECAGSD